MILVKPTDEFEKQVMEYRQAFIDNNQSFDGCAGLKECESYHEWLDFENRLKKNLKESYVPSTVLLAIRKKDNKLIGIIDFRHKLNDFLFNYGGHIGYSVSIDERKKGYAKEMLKQMLLICKQMGNDKILVTCNKNNEASRRTIVSNGGILEDERQYNESPDNSIILQRYWIKL
ncbi:MAG: GNAT family N-acetyltransferase [Mollicutes bacterium]|nr:GNAT family N-acetyltransferase [Mollicutes bacterium]